jgi:2'-5' RNA ligase
MPAVVSLLDAQHTQDVERLWDAVAEHLGIEKIPYAYPHLTYHAATYYANAAQLLPTLQTLAQNLTPFEIRVSGVGIFTYPRRVLYLPVARNEALSALQQQVYTLMRGATQELFYSPEYWLPHVSLSVFDIKTAMLPRAIAFLSQHELEWRIRVDNLCLVQDKARRDGGWTHIALGTGEATPYGER